jgi:hypothetical protein
MGVGLAASTAATENALVSCSFCSFFSSSLKTSLKDEDWGASRSLDWGFTNNDPSNGEDVLFGGKFMVIVISPWFSGAAIF